MNSFIVKKYFSIWKYDIFNSDDLIRQTHQFCVECNFCLPEYRMEICPRCKSNPGFFYVV